MNDVRVQAPAALPFEASRASDIYDIYIYGRSNQACAETQKSVRNQFRKNEPTSKSPNRKSGFHGILKNRIKTATIYPMFV